jgi:hypothetical protein
MNSRTMRALLRRTTVAAAACILCSGAAWAQGKSTNKDMCNPSQMTQVVESKACPGGQVVKRACCTKTSEKGTKTRCKSFPHCPHRSRS